MIKREEIITWIKETFIDHSDVNAYWLEGADGTGKVDEFSDVDIVLDVKDGKEDEIFKTIDELFKGYGELDLNYEQEIDHPKLRQKFYHFKNSSEYLIIDFCVQSHSRDKKESTFSYDDLLEVPKVIFDKKSIVNYEVFDDSETKVGMRMRIEELKSRYTQHSRVVKFIERDQYLEAIMYYGKYVAEPIVELMRMKYTPKYHYLHLIHITDHVPSEEKEILEKLYQNANLEDLRKNVKFARTVYNKLLPEVEKLLQQ